MSAASKTFWLRFADRPGAVVDGVVGIASEHAIGGLVQLLRQRRPKRVLEIGAGIGTLTFVLLDTLRNLAGEAREALVVTVENNDFCRHQLSVNLAEFEGRYRLIASTAELHETGPGAESPTPFDLIVIDGGGDLPNDMGVMDFSGLLAPRGAILVEGGRRFQQQRIQRWYGERPYVYLKHRSRTPLLGSKEGTVAENKPYHLFVFEPSLRERLGLRSKAFINRAEAAIRRRLP